MSPYHDQTGDWIRRNPRKTGAFSLLIGGAFIYHFMIKPMHEAAAGAGQVDLSLKACAVGVCLVVVGLAFFLGGTPVAAVLRPAPGESRVAAYMVGSVIAAIGISAFFLLKSHLESFGYVFHYFPYASTHSPPAFSAASSSTYPSSTAWTEATAQTEAVRRYPQLGVRNSPLNRAFVARYQQIKANDPSYLRDPSWPLHLADEVAQQTQRH